MSVTRIRGGVRGVEPRRGPAPAEQEFARQLEQTMHRPFDVVLRDQQVQNAVEIQVFERRAPAESEAGDAGLHGDVAETEVAVIAQHEPFMGRLLVVAPIALDQSGRDRVAEVAQENIEIAVGVDVAEGEPHPEAVAGTEIRPREPAVAEVAQNFDLAGVLRQHEVEPAVTIEIDKRRDKRVLKSAGDSVRHIGKFEIAVVPQQHIAFGV